MTTFGAIHFKGLIQFVKVLYSLLKFQLSLFKHHVPNLLLFSTTHTIEGSLLDKDTAEPAYSYIVYSRFLAIVELNLVPFAFISLLFYPCYSRLLL